MSHLCRETGGRKICADGKPTKGTTREEGKGNRGTKICAVGKPTKKTTREEGKGNRGRKRPKR